MWYHVLTDTILWWMDIVVGVRYGCNGVVGGCPDVEKQNDCGSVWLEYNT